MRVRQVLALALVLAKIPLNLLVTIVINIVNLLAPDFMFKLIKKAVIAGDNMHMGKMENSIKSTQDVRYLFSLEYVKVQVQKKISDIFKAAQVGQEAPNPELIDLRTRNRVWLLSLARAGKPLVLNFGSCT